MEINYCPLQQRKTQFQTFLIYIYIYIYIYIVEIPTHKGEHSWKYTELPLKRKEVMELKASEDVMREWLKSLISHILPRWISSKIKIMHSDCLAAQQECQVRVFELYR